MDIDALSSGNVRHDLEIADLQYIYQLPITKLSYLAQGVTQSHHQEDEVQLCTLLSVKTGGCKEDCAYCPQSAHYQTEVDAHGLLKKDAIVAAAQKAKEAGSTRFCMGAAWRSPPKKGEQFNELLSAISAVDEMGLEVCTTLGMLDEEQAHALKSAGVYAYNHNIDSSPEFYEKIISTRKFSERLETLKNVRSAGMTICCGGIIGMGETIDDRLKMLLELHRMEPHPESVPINVLVPVEGTPLAQQDTQVVDPIELAKLIAVARLIMPKSKVRLSAGRLSLSNAEQALCFCMGANSIFAGEKLLTTPNPAENEDAEMLSELGLRPAPVNENRHVHA